MNNTRIWLLPASFIVALVLQMLPLPRWFVPYNPEWVTLVLCYWCLNPRRRYAGIGLGWCAGLLSDVLETTLLGQQALSKCTAGLMMVLWRRRFRMYLPWQQSLFMAVPVAVDILVFGAVETVYGSSTLRWESFVPVLSSALVWPWVAMSLASLDRRSDAVRVQ